MTDFWPACGFAHIQRNEQGWMQPTADWWRLMMARPELAIVEESCRAEKALHLALLDHPLRAVSAAELHKLRDPDARENYAHWLAWRDGVNASGTLEAWLLQLFRSGDIKLPPLFIDMVVQTLLRGLLDTSHNAFEARAAELLFRTQRISTQDGHVLAGDQATLDMQNETHGFGDLGRLLAQAKAPLKAVQMEVLNRSHVERYWQQAAQPPLPGQAHSRCDFLLDLTHEIKQDLGHGIQFNMTHADSGLKALATVLRLWVHHLLGVDVRINPLQHIDDANWRWHVGLDAEANALLNDLYEEREVPAERSQRLLSLFKLEFEHAHEMRADVAGKPVYLGMMMTTEHVLRLKPQNLLLNLPLALAS